MGELENLSKEVSFFKLQHVQFNFQFVTHISFSRKVVEHLDRRLATSRVHEFQGRIAQRAKRATKSREGNE